MGICWLAKALVARNRREKMYDKTHEPTCSAIMTTRIAGGLLFGYNPKGGRASVSRRWPSLRSGHIALASLAAAGSGYLAKGSSYSLTLNLSSAWSCASCSRMYFAIVASLSPTVDT